VAKLYPFRQGEMGFDLRLYSHLETVLFCQGKDGFRTHSQLRAGAQPLRGTYGLGNQNHRTSHSAMQLPERQVKQQRLNPKEDMDLLFTVYRLTRQCQYCVSNRH
jgi:hypothetical protein